MVKPNSFLALVQHKTLRCEKFLNEMEKIIPWGQLLSHIAKYYQTKEVGRKRKELIMMIKIYFLQQWYNLSDPAIEEAIYDRNSFQKFLGIDLLSETAPDETTILNFRHLLEKHEVQKKFFTMVNKVLAQKGLIMKEGTIVDATIIEAPSSTKNEEGKRDPEMSSTEKNGNWHFGMKLHIGVDSKNGIVHSLEGTTAKVSDKKKMNDLFHGEEKVKLGDKGYYDENEKRQAKKDGIYWGILDRGKRNHPLSHSQKKRNKKLSSVRSKVEFPFHVVKVLWKHEKVRYRGLLKNTLQFYTLFALTNLYRMRKKLITC